MFADSGRRSSWTQRRSAWRCPCDDRPGAVRPGPVIAHGRQPSAPVRGRAGAHALTELPRGLLEQLAGAPVEDDTVAADHIVDGDLILSVAAGHLGGIGVEPGGAFGPDPSPFARRRRLIDFVL